MKGFDLGLAALTFRRVAPTALGLAVLVGAMVAFTGDGQLADVAQRPELASAGRRAAVWLAGSAAALPFILFGAASFGRRWRAGERGWLATRGLSTAAVVAAVWSGAWLAAIGTAGALGLAAELAAGGSQAPALRCVRSVPAQPALLVADDASVTWEVGDGDGVLAGGATLRLALAAAPGSGPAARVRFACARTATGEERAVELSLTGREQVDLELPPAAPGTTGGDVELRVERLGAGCAVAVTRDAMTLLEPTSSPRAGSLALFARASLFAGAWCALAVALGAWMGPLTAAALASALALLALCGGESAWVPGGDLARAVEAVGRGVVPEAMDARVLVQVGVLVLAASVALPLTARGLDAEGVE